MSCEEAVHSCHRCHADLPFSTVSQFGSDLDAGTRYTLERGARLTELLKQRQYSPLATEVQIPIIFAGVNGLLDNVPVEQIVEWEESFREHLQSQSDLLKDIEKGVMTKELEEKMKSTIKSHVEGYLQK